MSIYSGFATRNQENYYDKILYNVISTLLVRLIKFYTKESVDQQKFQKIILKQEKIIKKMQKRKYLDPKYGQLLEDFLSSIPNTIQKDSNKDSRRKIQMNRTLSLIDHEMHELKQQAQKYISKLDTEEQPSRTLGKIQQLPRPKKHKSKSKKNSMKSYVDLWQLRHQKLPQIPSLHPVEHSIITKNNFYSKNESISEVQNPQSEKQYMNGETISAVGKRTFFNKPLNFRANMFMRK